MKSPGRTEQVRLFEKNLQEISKIVAQTMKLLAVSDRRSAPAKYLTIVRNARALKEMWSRHIQSERGVFTGTESYDSEFTDNLNQIIRDNEALEKQLASLVAAPWPRSPQAGLQTIRARAVHVLTQLLSQVERERAIVLPVIGRGLTAKAETQSKDSEMVTT